MAKRNKVYTVYSVMVDRETGEQKKWAEHKFEMMPDGEMVMISEIQYIDEKKTEAFVNEMGKNIQENLTDAAIEQILSLP